jgi:glutathione S-transferase
MFTLYFAAHTCSLATHIVLEDVGAKFALKRIRFDRNEQRSPAYLEVNPKGRVPALATPHGILTETPAMLAFIAQSYPKARLAPLHDPFAFAEMQAFNSYLCSTPTACAATAGPTRRHRSPTCSARSRNRSAPATT